MSKDKKPDLYDLFNDDSLWGNQETDTLSHDDIMDVNWNKTTANREKAKDPDWIEAQKKGCQEYINSPTYVHPRGMLGKKRTADAIQKTIDSVSGKPKSFSHNKKLKNAKKGRPMSEQAKQKLRACNTGKTTSKVRRVWTKEKGEFDKLKFAAEAFGVSSGAIKLWMKTKPDEFKFLSELPNAKNVHTERGIFENVSAVAQTYQITPQAVRYRIKQASWPEWYYQD